MADGKQFFFLLPFLSHVDFIINRHHIIIIPLPLICQEQDQDVVYEEIVEGPQPHVIETGDSVKVKQVLDDATSETLIENGFLPNYFWENMKLFLMFLSCVFAMIAQFYPIPFPDSRPLLGFCCAMYFVLSTILQLMITFIDKDTIMIGKPDQVIFIGTIVRISCIIQTP